MKKDVKLNKSRFTLRLLLRKHGTFFLEQKKIMTKLFTTYAINICPIYEHPHMTINIIRPEQDSPIYNKISQDDVEQVTGDNYK